MSLGNLADSDERPTAGPAPPGLKLAIGLPVRDVAEYLPRLLDVLLDVASMCGDARIVIAENDSSDSTAQLVRDLARSDSRVSLLQYPRLGELLPVRTDRLAFLRNSIVEELVSLTDHEEDWTAVMLDADEVTSLLSGADVIGLVDFLYKNPEYCGATANSQPVYYDVWTLRCDGWSPDDCWTQVDQRPESVTREAAIRTFVADRQRTIDADSAPIAVSSAFGGLAAYRLADITRCRYGGHSKSGEACSDHVPMHAELTQLTSKPLVIVPNVNLQAPSEHIAENYLSAPIAASSDQKERSGGRAVNSLYAATKKAGRRVIARSGLAWHLRHDSTVNRTRRIDEFDLMMGEDHALPEYTSQFRAYDRPVRSIGSALRRSHGRRIRAIDVGANIGDTTVALVVAAGADVLAIEGDRQYMEALHKNTSAIADRVTIFDGYVTAGGEVRSAIENFAGTGRLITGESDSAAASGVQTRAIGDVLDDAGWNTADLFKSDTDGHDFEIIGAALELPWPKRPVLFFVFDPELDPGGAAAGLRLIDDAISKGYRRWYVWDNFGNFLLRVENDHVERFEELAAYLTRCREAGGGLYYFDVAAFCDHHPPFDGLVELRSSHYAWK